MSYIYIQRSAHISSTSHTSTAIYPVTRVHSMTHLSRLSGPYLSRVGQPESSRGLSRRSSRSCAERGKLIARSCPIRQEGFCPHTHRRQALKVPTVRVAFILSLILLVFLILFVLVLLVLLPGRRLRFVSCLQLAPYSRYNPGIHLRTEWATKASEPYRVAKLPHHLLD